MAINADAGRAGKGLSTRVEASSAYINVTNLTKVYHSPRGTVTALDDINLSIRESEFVSVLGPSGCGKSTLLKCIGGLENATSGSVHIQNRRLDGPPPNMNVVFQSDVLLDWRTVLDNVLLTAELRKLDLSEYRAQAKMLLVRLGLRGFEHRHPWELSGGMRQRVSICRALLTNPDLLLMDEPFGALDAMTRDDLNFELTRIWQETRKTILFVTHSITEAIFLSDRVVMMSKNPGHILKVANIDIARPRRLSVRETVEFSEYAALFRDLFTKIGVFEGER